MSDGWQEGTSPVYSFLFLYCGLLRRRARSLPHKEVDPVWIKVNVFRWELSSLVLWAPSCGCNLRVMIGGSMKMVSLRAQEPSENQMRHEKGIREENEKRCCCEAPKCKS